ncbi:MAG: hypothetical protein F6K50_12340 [Moorea sp. SIO3I7]|uniref:terminase large subunit domain-containing protein n=1 Tax=Moorena sp. SIO3I8 TaxID=2607833 RepID=UPI0013BFF5C0|nr:terminase family protein [Moorena sp. SIO3I8]NEN96295.1 hypothetical protein [Moorena sp. SIO3I7]NEO04939.1 hypothetical protein [Moorena sp. SIO3I8]
MRTARSRINKLKRQAIAEILSEEDGTENKPDALDSFIPMPGGQTEFVNAIRHSQHLVNVQGLNYRGYYLRGGIGSGKSRAGAYYCCYRAKLDPSARGLISANEYGQLETSTLVALAEFCQDFSIPLSPVGNTPEETARIIASRRFCTIYQAPFLVLSANKFDGGTLKARQGARGIEIRTAWLDEWAYSSRMAFQTLVGRIGRGKGNLPGQFVITSSINRNDPFNWVYDMFVDPEREEKLKQMYYSICCLTSDNTSLDPDYLRSLEASYPPELAALELRGEYVAVTIGLIFRYFKRSQHLDGGIGVQPNIPLHLSFDFNHSPACAIAAQVPGVQEVSATPNRIYVIKEWHLINSDTFELAKTVTDWVRQFDFQSIFVYGDASGSARTANSKTTNWSIVMSNLAGLPWRQRWGKSNPSVIDSIHSCNSLFFSDRVLVHPSCKELIKDFESLKFDQNGKVDKSDILRSHLADCFRYLCHSLYPIPGGNQWHTSLASWG